jgi:hypothetical protein
MDQHPNAPGNTEMETAVTVAKPAAGQEVLGPTDSLGKSGLDLGLLRMELETAMEHALRHRRNISVVIEQIRAMALYNDAAANRCVYALPRSDKAIIGPSVGLATIIATSWGNCVDSGWWVRTDRENKIVVCAGSFIDLQTNRRSGATVTRRIEGKEGRIYNSDMIAVTIQAATSIAQRNAILKGVPAPIWWPIYEEALVVVRGTMETLPERRTKMIAAFAQFGVEARKIFGALGVKDERCITLDHMVMLRGMYEQLRDETVTAEELFDPRRMTSEGFDRVHRPLGDDGDEVSPPSDRPGRAGNGAAGPIKAPTSGPAAANTNVVAKEQQPSGAHKKAAGAGANPPMPDSADAGKASPEPSGKTGAAFKTSGGAAAAIPWARKTGADYVEWAASWMTTAASADEINGRYTAERSIRNSLGTPLDEKELAELMRIKKAALDRCGGPSQ